jgi:hypothetical protein
VGGPALGWKPFLVIEPQDMKSCWLCLHRGGAEKYPSVKHFFHLCHTIRSDDIALLNQVPCASCDNQQECECDDNPIKRNNKKCYHHPVMDAQAVQRVKIEFARLQICPIA